MARLVNVLQILTTFPENKKCKFQVNITHLTSMESVIKIVNRISPHLYSQYISTLKSFDSRYTVEQTDVTFKPMIHGYLYSGTLPTELTNVTQG